MHQSCKSLPLDLLGGQSHRERQHFPPTPGVSMQRIEHASDECITRADSAETTHTRNTHRLAQQFWSLGSSVRTNVWTEQVWCVVCECERADTTVSPWRGGWGNGQTDGTRSTQGGRYGLPQGLAAPAPRLAPRRCPGPTLRNLLQTSPLHNHPEATVFPTKPPNARRAGTGRRRTGEEMG